MLFRPSINWWFYRKARSVAPPHIFSAVVIYRCDADDLYRSSSAALFIAAIIHILAAKTITYLWPMQLAIYHYRDKLLSHIYGSSVALFPNYFYKAS